jgi:hypothetical protein
MTGKAEVGRLLAVVIGALWLVNIGLWPLAILVLIIDSGLNLRKALRQRKDASR